MVPSRLGGRWSALLLVVVVSVSACSSGPTIKVGASSGPVIGGGGPFTSKTPLIVREVTDLQSKMCGTVSTLAALAVDGSGCAVLGNALISINTVAAFTPTAGGPGVSHTLLITLVPADAEPFNKVMNGHLNEIVAFMLGSRFVMRVAIARTSSGAQFALLAPDADLIAVLDAFGDHQPLPPGPSTSPDQVPSTLPTAVPILFQRVTPNGTTIVATETKRTSCAETVVASLGSNNAEFGASVGNDQAADPLVILSVQTYYRDVVVIVHSALSQTKNYVAKIRWDMGGGDEMQPVKGWAVLDVGPPTASVGPSSSVPPTVTEGGTITAFDSTGKVITTVTVPNHNVETPEPACAIHPTSTPPTT